MSKSISIPYTPRAIQAELHAAWSKHRYSVSICHRRAGKTVAVLNHLLRDALMSKKPNPRFHYLAPTYRMAKTVAWDYLKQFTENIPGCKFNETSLHLDLPNGGRLSLLSGDDEQKHRGIYSDGICIDECGLMSETIYPEIIRPALSDRNGLNGEKTYAIFIGTPLGHNVFYDYYNKAKEDPEWHCAMYKASETNVIPQEELRAARNSMPIDAYNQEFECSFEANVPGAVYAKELQSLDENNQIGKIPYDPALKVRTFWDLGINDHTSIIFAQVSHGGRSINIIDHVSMSGEGLPFYAKLLDEKNYSYESHTAPHDIVQRELGTGKTRQETALSLGINFRVAPKLPLEEGLNAVKMTLPRCWIDREKCAGLLESLRFYHRVYDPKNQIFKSTPRHDWSSHNADAMRTLATSVQQTVQPTIESNYSRRGSMSGSWMS